MAEDTRKANANGDDHASLAELASQLHAELAATEERPVERTASRWIGEAQAVAADAHEADLDDVVIRKRAEQVRELLENVDETGDEVADEHVAAARRLAGQVIETGDGTV